MKTNMMTPRAVAIALLLAAAGTAHAGAITVVNPGFETVTNDANTAACLTGGSLTTGFFIDDQSNFGASNGCVDASPLPGWVLSGGSAGVQNVGASTSLFPSGVPDGTNVAASNGGILAQTLSANLQPGVYTLNVEIGNRLDSTFLHGYTIELLAGGVVVGSDSSVTPDRGAFALDSLVIPVSFGNANLGGQLSIELFGSTTQADFDSVSLGFSASAPEPSSGLLVVLGLAAAGRLLKKR